MPAILEMLPFEDDEQARKTFAQLLAVGEFTAPARFVAKCMEAKSFDPYVYQFTGYRTGDPLKACHGAEVAYVLGNLSRTKCDETDRELSDKIMEYWVNFAATGNPNGGNLPEWPPFSSSVEDYMIIGKPISKAQAVWKELCDLAEEIYAPIYLD